MSTIQIVQLSEDFSAQYPAALGTTYDELLTATAEGYVSLWETKYANHPSIDAMRDAEGINVETARANIAAFCTAATATSDSLQSGDRKSMHIAIDSETGKVQGLIQISDFKYDKFAEQRRAPLMAAYNHIEEALGGPNPDETEPCLYGVFDMVSKPQREYHATPEIGDALMYTALDSAEQFVFIVSYDAAERDFGYESVAETTTMDSGTPCHFMIGKTATVMDYLSDAMCPRDSETIFKQIELTA